jgi:hypothetical protein
LQKPLKIKPLLHLTPHFYRPTRIRHLIWLMGLSSAIVSETKIIGWRLTNLILPGVQKTKNKIMDSAIVVLAWLLALSLAYMVFIKFKLLFH